MWSLADEVKTPRGILIGGAQAGVTAPQALEAFQKLYPASRPKSNRRLLMTGQKSRGPPCANEFRIGWVNWLVSGLK